METTPTLREKDTSGGEERHEEDKRKVKKLYSSFLLELGVLLGGVRDGVRVKWAVYARVKEIRMEDSAIGWFYDVKFKVTIF